MTTLFLFRSNCLPSQFISCHFLRIHHLVSVSVLIQPAAAAAAALLRCAVCPQIHIFTPILYFRYFFFPQKLWEHNPILI